MCVECDYILFSFAFFPRAYVSRVFISIQNGNDNTFDDDNDDAVRRSMNVVCTLGSRVNTETKYKAVKETKTEKREKKKKFENVNQDIPIFSNVYLHSRHFLASQLFAQRNTKQTHDELDERHHHHRTDGRTLYTSIGKRHEKRRSRQNKKKKENRKTEKPSPPTPPTTTNELKWNC